MNDYRQIKIFITNKRNKIRDEWHLGYSAFELESAQTLPLKRETETLV